MTDEQIAYVFGVPVELLEPIPEAVRNGAWLLEDTP